MKEGLEVAILSRSIRSRFVPREQLIRGEAPGVPSEIQAHPIHQGLEIRQVTGLDVLVSRIRRRLGPFGDARLEVMAGLSRPVGRIVIRIIRRHCEEEGHRSGVLDIELRASPVNGDASALGDDAQIDCVLQAVVPQGARYLDALVRHARHLAIALRVLLRRKGDADGDASSPGTESPRDHARRVGCEVFAFVRRSPGGESHAGDSRPQIDGALVLAVPPPGRLRELENAEGLIAPVLPVAVEPSDQVPLGDVLRTGRISLFEQLLNTTDRRAVLPVLGRVASGVVGRGIRAARPQGLLVDEQLLAVDLAVDRGAEIPAPDRQCRLLPAIIALAAAREPDHLRLRRRLPVDEPQPLAVLPESPGRRSHDGDEKGEGEYPSRCRGEETERGPSCVHARQLRCQSQMSFLRNYSVTGDPIARKQRFVPFHFSSRAPVRPEAQSRLGA